MPALNTLKPASHWINLHGVSKQAFRVKMQTQGIKPAYAVGQVFLWDVAKVEAALKRSPFRAPAEPKAAPTKKKTRPNKRDGSGVRSAQ